MLSICAGILGIIVLVLVGAPIVVWLMSLAEDLAKIITGRR